jgi:hypothetical protein
MKNSIKYLKLLGLCFTLLLISSCSDDGGGSDEIPEVQESKIKKISFDNGDEIESWEFNYDTDGRVTTIANVYEGGTPEMTTYDYSKQGELVITRGSSPTIYAIDSQGRITKEYWNEEKTEWAAFEYDSAGFLVKLIEHYGNTDYLKFANTITNGNITNRVRYQDDGVTVREDRVFSYTIADNKNDIHQVFTVDSQWRNTGGFYGVQSKKLASNYVRKITSDPTSSFGVTFAYTFDDKNRVVTQIKNGTGSGGSFSESISYTYYEE